MARKRTKYPTKTANARTYSYTVVIEPDEGGSFHAYCPALPGCHTHGKTLDAAKKHIHEAIEVYIEALKIRGQPVPEESEGLIVMTAKVLDPDVAAAA